MSTPADIDFRTLVREIVDLDLFGVYLLATGVFELAGVFGTHVPRHAAPDPAGAAVRVVQRFLALPPAIWHNHHTDQPVIRSLTAYDH